MVDTFPGHTFALRALACPVMKKSASSRRPRLMPEFISGAHSLVGTNVLTSKIMAFSQDLFDAKLIDSAVIYKHRAWIKMELNGVKKDFVSRVVWKSKNIDNFAMLT